MAFRRSWDSPRFPLLFFRPSSRADFDRGRFGAAIGRFSLRLIGEGGIWNVQYGDGNEDAGIGWRPPLLIVLYPHLEIELQPATVELLGCVVFVDVFHIEHISLLLIDFRLRYAAIVIILYLPCTIYTETEGERERKRKRALL